MRQAVCEVLASCGREMTLFSEAAPEGRKVLGHIQPIGQTDTDSLHIQALPGGVRRGKFLLLLGPKDLKWTDKGAWVSCDGRAYTILRADPMTFGGAITHWEAIVRMKGAVQTDD